MRGVLRAFRIRQIFQYRTLHGLSIPRVELPTFTEAFSSHIFMLAIWCNKTYKSFLECMMELMEARRIILTQGGSLGYVCTVALRIYL